MAYNLPPAWDPGFVLPKNVEDEGLERRAFITKMLPRGSYSQPKVGSGGYVLPEYVEDEGYGQGTYTTYWQPGGTYNGPKVPHWLNRRPQLARAKPLPGGATQVTIQAQAPQPMTLSDDEAPLPQAFEDYGQKAAQMLIARVSTVTPARRAATMKAILDKVDKSLWSRTQDIWNRYRAQGVAPADAFPMALAKAMSAGIAAEIIMAGLKSEAPQAKSLLGLGCYGPMAALGADAAPATTAAPVTTTSTGCSTSAGYSWVYGAPVAGQYVSGYWMRTPAGQADMPRCAAPPAGAATAATQAASGNLTVRVAPPDTFSVGPFEFHISQLHDTPLSNWSVRNSTPDLFYLSPDPSAPIPGSRPIGDPRRQMQENILSWLGTLLTQTQDAGGNTDKMVKYTDNSAIYGYPGDNYPMAVMPDVAKWFTAMGVGPTTPVRLTLMRDLRNGYNAIAHTTHPTTGKDLLLFTVLQPAYGNKPWDATTNPMSLKVWLVPAQDKGLLGKILSVPFAIGGVISDVTTGALNELGDLACGLLNAGDGVVGKAAGAGAAAVVGVPPQAGVAGATIAQGACGKPPPAPAPPVAKAASSLLPLAILGGGAIVAVMILTSGRRSAP